MATILVDGVPTEVGDKPITLLCHQGDVHLAPSNQVEIGPEQTLARAARVTDDEWAALCADPSFVQLFHIVFPDIDPQPMRKLHREGTGVRHIVGMLLMMAELTPDQQPFLRYPESFLHPSAQSRLAELFVFFTGGKR